MHPWLWLGDSLRLPTYMTSITAGFVIATLALAREIRASGLPPRDVYDIALPILPAAWVGARLFMVFEEPERFLADPWELVRPGAGWVFYGGFILAAILVLLQARRRGLDPWAVGDALSPVFPLGITFGRLGCLGAGCCHGRPADWPLGVEVPWSVRYYVPGHVPAELLGVSLHPTPLYESALGLALFVTLTLLHRRQRFTGQTGATLLAGYGAGRFVIELFRGDLERGFHFDGWLSTSQVTGLVGVLAGAVLWTARSRAAGR
ncbi:MAG TPA: prolipoprotein diacylglyceryl transferase [Myxococcota bacterium]|nr:prolipoprotein diacylglyceryl transferase [Myxococcota bacterium]